jgi:hypothetical protein
MLSGIFLILLVLQGGCVGLSALPATTQDAAKLGDHPDGSTLVELVIVQLSMEEGLKAAAAALRSAGYDELPTARTPERRCGEHPTTFEDWGFHACFYLEPMQQGMLKTRIVAEVPRVLGIQRDRPWHLELAMAYKNRVDYLKKDAASSGESLRN